MSDKSWAWLMIVIGTGQVLVLVAALSTLRGPDLSKPPARPVKGEAWYRRVLTTAQHVGVKIMSVVDEALARLTTFIKNVSTQLVVARQTNAVQTGKLNELQVALETALSDDAADKARIAALQTEISDLQNAVAAQINTVVDALENPPLEDPAAEPPAEAPADAPADVPVEEPVADTTETPVDGEGDAPVE